MAMLIDPKKLKKKKTILWDEALGFCECVLVEDIDQEPAIDAAEVIHGHWDEWWPGDCALIMTGEEMLYQCSACTAKYSDIEGKRYCPNCGAFMDE